MHRDYILADELDSHKEKSKFLNSKIGTALLKHLEKFPDVLTEGAELYPTEAQGAAAQTQTQRSQD